MKMARFRFLVLVCLLLTFGHLAEARASQIVIALQTPSELLPSRVCVLASRVSDRLAKKKDVDWNQFATDPIIGTARSVSDGLTPPCVSNQNACERCDIPSYKTGTFVCIAVAAPAPAPPAVAPLPAAPPAATPPVAAPPVPAATSQHARLPSMRDLFLKVDGVLLSDLTVRGADLVLDVDVPEGSRALVEGLGGAYYPVLAHAVSVGETLAVPLRNRCVRMPLEYVVGSGDSGSSLSCNSGATKAAFDDFQENAALATLLVPEAGAVTTVELHRGSTTYEGQFSDPSAGAVKLEATTFRFTWQKSCFVLGRRKAPSIVGASECPAATLVGPGKACDLVSGAALTKKDECTYTCSTERALEFPTPVRLELEPPTRNPAPNDAPDVGKASSGGRRQDSIAWQDSISTPGAVLRSFTAKEDRAFYLSWPPEPWTERGQEIDAVEITTPDGNVHRLTHDADRVVVGGLQCSAALSYHYAGRVPHRVVSAEVSGDRFDLPPAEHAQQVIVLGVRAHGGVLHDLEADSSVSYAPKADLELFALIDARYVISLSGEFTSHPSVSQFADESERWSSSTQVRTRLLGGYVFRFWSSDVYLAPEIGGGLATRALAADWSKSKPSFIAEARVRLGFDISNSVAVEFPMLTYAFYETFISERQNLAGPLPSVSRYTGSLSIALGLQWTNAL
jgi:hypothetical protein